ncbi:MAG: UDP-2,3-diacylglucosamine diphosphatase [Rubricoccaceae bacterium]|nr:UDP-2,3-diacylglucosamine diphosphatase [Rubricoccaceae bacterium]
MFLFLSDLHLGRGDAAESKAAEQDAVALLRAYADDIVRQNGGLFLVGDVFDQYMEYKHLIPKGFSRFIGLLAEWSDRGIPITYIVGNRDPWHINYFESDVGVRVVRESIEVELNDAKVFVLHGDGIVSDEWFYNAIRSLIRHPFIHRLYRMCLPGDSGFAFARWFVHNFSSDGSSNEKAVAALKMRAEHILTHTDADIVVMGHCHHADCIPMDGGTYINPGYWFADRTFAVLDSTGPRIESWRNSAIEPNVSHVQQES